MHRDDEAGSWVRVFVCLAPVLAVLVGVGSLTIGDGLLLDGLLSPVGLLLIGLVLVIGLSAFGA